MTELGSTKLDPDSHLLLDQPLLRVPNELLRKNLKAAQRQIEITNKAVTTAIQSSTSQSPAETLASLDSTLAKAQNLKRKLEALQAEEKTLHKQQKARIHHLNDLHEIPTLADVKYTTWSRIRLDRLLVDYLLRQGFNSSAKALAAESQIENLVDINVFDECGKIERSLRAGRVQECLAWCTENKQALKKIESNLELELRLQQFVELARSGEMNQRLEAMMYARKHLAGGADPMFALQAAGILAQPADTPVEPYRVRSCTPFVSPEFGRADGSTADNILRSALHLPRHGFPQYPPHTPDASVSTTPPHRPLSRSFRAQNTCLPLHAPSINLSFDRRTRLPHLQYRAQRARA